MGALLYNGKRTGGGLTCEEDVPKVGQLPKPIFLATGRVADIGPLLQFSWMEPVHHKINDSAFPSESPEALGFWVGVAEHVGHDHVRPPV